jgi:hypothetical protein
MASCIEGGKQGKGIREQDLEEIFLSQKGIRLGSGVTMKNLTC